MGRCSWRHLERQPRSWLAKEEPRVAIATGLWRQPLGLLQILARWLAASKPAMAGRIC